MEFKNLNSWINFFHDWFNLDITDNDLIYYGKGLPGCYKVLVPKEVNLTNISEVLNERGFLIETDITNFERDVEGAKRVDEKTYIAYDNRLTVVELSLLYLFRIYKGSLLQSLPTHTQSRHKKFKSNQGSGPDSFQILLHFKAKKKSFCIKGTYIGASNFLFARHFYKQL